MQIWLYFSKIILGHSPFRSKYVEVKYMVLFRPVGQAELELIADSRYRAFPPRLPEQPIFYPVLNEKYASEIAQRWNATEKFSGYTGYVTRFEIADEFIKRYDVHTVGASYHQEYWIPAEELVALNQHIIGEIEVIRSYV